MKKEKAMGTCKLREKCCQRETGRGGRGGRYCKLSSTKIVCLKIVVRRRDTRYRDAEICVYTNPRLVPRILMHMSCTHTHTHTLRVCNTIKMPSTSRRG